MGRNVKPRIDYENDASYLLRLIKAIELDDSVGLEWKRETIANLSSVRASFLEHASKRAATLAEGT